MEKHYQLSPFYKLSSKGDSETLLYHILDHETYSINSVIHTYLSFFIKEPVSFLKSVALFAKEYEGTSEEVLPAVNKFFGDMFHQSILIREEEFKHLNAFPKQKEIQEKAFLQTYNIKKTLSKEYYLSIYLVENIKNKQLSILKILHLNAFFSLEDKKTFRTSFLQEINILKKIKEHNGIVKILQNTDSENIMSLELEYATGVSLRQFVADNSEMTFKNRKKLYQNIIAAYAHLHRLGILHGDIHASNILVQERFLVKLIDFDMAYHNTPIRGEIITKGGVQPYIAPEKISKNALEIANKRADFRSEVYQIGVIGYIIFFGKLPFEADSWKQLAAKIKKEQPDFNNPNLPQNLIGFLQRAMHKKTTERFESAMEMEAQLAQKDTAK